MNLHARAIFFFAAALFSVLFATQSASAAPSQKDKMAARAAHMKGKKLSTQKKHDDAIEQFREADRLDPKPQYKLDLARALIETSSLVEASGLLAEAQESKAPADRQVANAAKQLETKLTPRIPTLTVSVKGPDASLVKLTIDRDSATIDEPIKLDPGQYEVRAEADGYTAAKKTVTLKEGEKKNLPLSLSVDPTIAKTEEGEGEEEGEKGGGGNMIPAVIAFGVGGAGVALGTIFGIVAFSKTSAIEEACGGKICPPAAESDIAAAQAYGNVSTAMFVIGGAGVATGVILAFTVGSGSGSDEPEKKDEAALTVEPYFTGMGAGVTGTF